MRNFIFCKTSIFPKNKLMFQGYETSLLKVTNKNGKSAAVGGVCAVGKI